MTPEVTEIGLPGRGVIRVDNQKGQLPGRGRVTGCFTGEREVTMT